MRILCYGDSNTWGFIPGSGERYPSDTRWTGVLSELTKAQIIEEGLNGRTTVFQDNLEPFREGLAYAAPCVMSHFPLNWIIIMLGTNDCKTRYGVSAAEIGYGLEEVIMRMQEFCRRKNQSPKFLILSPALLKINEDNIEFNRKAEEKVRQLKAEYQRVAKDFQCEFLAASDYVKDIGSDGIHFTAEGHRNLAIAIHNFIQTCS